MAGRSFSTSSQPTLSLSSGVFPMMSKQDEVNPGFASSKHPLAGAFSPSPRSSPGLMERRNSEMGPFSNGIGGLNNLSDSFSQAPRFNVSVFKSPFSEDNAGPIHRALDPIAPDQREPFITVESPPSAGASPSFRTVEGEKPYPLVESHTSSRERSIIGHIEHAEDSHAAAAVSGSNLLRQASLGGGITPFSIQRQNSISNSLTPRHSVSQDNYVSSNLSGPPVNVNTAPIMHDPVLASSPVSSASLPSASSAIAGGIDKALDAQLRNSPFLHDILDRVIRTEYAQRDISRELSALTNKINFLVERLEPPDSRRSFSSSPIPGVGIGNNISPLSPLANNVGGREDGDISKRLDALTNSVQQILLIQQNNAVTNGNNGPFPHNGPLNPPGGPGGFGPMGPDINLGGPGMMAHPNRPSGRTPHPPVRTWSAGSLDMPPRQDPHLTRPDALLNQKRRSVVGNLTRRDSSAVRIITVP
jgi:hypothetical protein